jgi:hypothetical protein
MKAVAARFALWRGGKAIGASLVGAAVWFGVACGAADSVNIPAESCTPRLCFAPDPADGPPTGASLCPTGACNYQTSGGCPDNQSCVIDIDPQAATASPRCTAAGLIKAGEPCDSSPTMPITADKLCARGLQCIGKVGESQVCRKLCCGEPGASYGDWRACDPGESCIRQIQPAVERPEGSGNFVFIDHPGVFACVPVNECDVLDADSCSKNTDDRTVCRIVDPLGRVACRPKQSSNSQVGGPCAHFDQCGPVQHCAQRTDDQGIPQSDKTCRRLCRITLECGSSACPQGQGVCVHFKRDPEGVGECTPNFDEDTMDPVTKLPACYEVDGGTLPAPPPPPPPSDAGTG